MATFKGSEALNILERLVPSVISAICLENIPNSKLFLPSPPGRVNIVNWILKEKSRFDLPQFMHSYTLKCCPNQLIKQKSNIGPGRRPSTSGKKTSNYHFLYVPFLLGSLLPANLIDITKLLESVYVYLVYHGVPMTTQFPNSQYLSIEQ